VITNQENIFFTAVCNQFAIAGVSDITNQSDQREIVINSELAGQSRERAGYPATFFRNILTIVDLAI